MKYRRATGRIASAPACRCRLDNTPGTAPWQRGSIFRLQVPDLSRERERQRSAGAFTR